jgi:hypothetical protein
MTTRAAYFATVVYAAVAMIAFGTLLSETLLLYPNIFADVPGSLELTLQFMTVATPNDVLPPIGMANIATAVVAVVLTLRRPAARLWAAGGLSAIVLGQFLFSVLYFWPRNEVMFTEGSAQHSAAYLQQVADEFQTGHWVRVAAGAVTALCALMAMLRMHREMLMTADAGQVTEAAG